MSSGYQEPVGGTASPSTGTAVGSKPIRAWLKVLRNVDIVAEPDYGSTYIPKIKTPIELLSTSLRLHNPAQTFYTNVESAALLANQSIKIPIITATESGNKKDELVFLKQSQSLENKTFPTFYDVTETAAPANPSAGTLRIYANSTTHELTQRNSAGTEVKLSDGTGGGGGGAPTDVSYVTLGTNATLTNERVLTASTRVTVTDGGVNSPVTLDVGSGSIVDAYIGSHTSTKISITAKGQLNSSIVYTDQANTMGDFDTSFRSSRLVLRDSDNSHSYFFAGSNLAANRTVTWPLLTGDDTAVTQAFAQPLTNKTVNASSNTITNIGDAEHAAHTSTKITITAKGQLNSSIAYIDQANVFSDNDQSFRSTRLRLSNPANTFFYNFTGAAIAANRTITLPLLTGNDTAVTEAFAQTLTNKTIAGGSNTITAIGDSAISSHTSTKITITAKGQLNSAILYNDVNQDLGAFYHDIGEIAAPSAPAANKLRVYMDNGDESLRVKNSSNTVFNLFSPTGLVDANIGTHTSTKITITAKGQLNSSILYSDVDNALGSHYMAITEIAQPGNPAAGTLRIWADSTTHELSQVDSAGTVKKFTDGSGGGGGAPTTSQYLTLATDATLTAERVLTASTRVTLTDAGAGSTATLDIGSGSITDTYIGSHTSTKISITAKGQLNSAIVYNDQTNAFGDFAQTFKDNQLKINNPADTFAYTIVAAAIGANRNLTLPLLAGNDTAVAEAFSQTLTNKTIDFASNTGTNVGDAAIASHTSTKITITTKGQLNSNIAYKDQTNTWGAFDQIFPTSRLLIGDSDASHQYIIAGSNLTGANRTITLPLLTGNDIAVMEAFAQPLTNKTIVAGSNTITGIVDANITAHTSTKVTITAKGQLNSNIVYNDQANTFGANNQTIPIANLLLSNNGNTGAFGVQASLTGARVWSMPNSSTNIMGHDTTDTMTNKTYNATGTGNALSNVGDTHIASHTSTKITITAKGQLNSQILYGDANKSFGAFYFDVAEIAAPANPAAGTLRIWADSTTHELSQRNSSGTVVKMSDGSGGGGITASSTDTLTNKTINPTSNILPYLAPFAYYIYNDGGAVKCRKNGDGTVTSHATLGPAIDVVLANTNDPTAIIASGWYDLASGFTGWSPVIHTHLLFEGHCNVNVPQGYDGNLFNFSPNNAVIYYVHIEGGTFDEQGTQENTWNGLDFGPTGTGAVFSCTFKHMKIWRCNKPLNFHTTGVSWVNQNHFEDLYFEACAYIGATMEHASTYTLNTSGMSGNVFINVSGQSALSSENATYPDVLGGWIINYGNFNSLISCHPWDLYKNGSASSCTIGSNAIGTKISGGITTNQNFVNNGTWHDIQDQFQGIVSWKGSFTGRPGGASTGYDPALSVIKAQDPAGFELIAEFGRGGSSDYFSLENSFDQTNVFSPLWRGRVTSTNAADWMEALHMQGWIKDANDTVSANPIMVFSVRKTTAAALGDNRPMVGFRNYTTDEYLFYPDRLDMKTNNLANVKDIIFEPAADRKIFFGTGSTAFIKLNTNSVIDFAGTGGQANMIVDPASGTGAGFQVWDAAYTHRYSIGTYDIAGNYTLKLPLITANDDLVANNTAATLTTKTIDAKSNTLVGVAQNPVYKRSGAYQPITATSGTTAAVVGKLEGILTNHVPTGPGTNTNTWDTTEGLLTNLITTTTINQNAGLVSPTAGLGVFRREQAAKMVYRGKIDTVAGGVARLYFGVSSNAAPNISDTIANGDSLVLVGFKAADANYSIYHNDGTGAHATTAITGAIAKNTSFHTIEIEWTASGNVVVTFDGTAQTISTDLPAASTNLYFHCLGQNATAAIRTHSIVGVWAESS